MTAGAARLPRRAVQDYLTGFVEDLAVAPHVVSDVDAVNEENLAAVLYVVRQE